MTGFAEINDVSPMSVSSGNRVNVELGSNGTITIELTLEDYDTIPVQIGNNRYYMIAMPEGHSPLMRGYPDLPVITKSFIIPENSEYVVKVIDEAFTDHSIPVAPCLGTIRRNHSRDEIQFVFSDTYNHNSFYPTEMIVTGEPYRIRDIQGGNVQICPFKYNPITNTLRVYNYLKVEISFPNYNLRGNLNNDKKVVNSHFYPLIKHKFVNTDYYVRNESEPFRLGEPLCSLDEIAAKMLVICCDSFVTEMRDFIIHKNNMGLPTTLVKMSDVGTTDDHLKTYIQNAYNADSDLTYVLLIGDSAQVPPPMIQYLDHYINGNPIYEYGAADPMLSLVSGNDNIPDIVIGRFSAETKSDVRTMVDRIIMYENLLESNWFHKGIGIASAEQQGDQGTHGYYESDRQHIRNIGMMLQNGHFTNYFVFSDSIDAISDTLIDLNSTELINSINSGVSLINYAGHGLVDRWESGNITNNSILGFENQEKLPFIFSVSCDVGKFNDSSTPCFAEIWQRAKSVNTGNPIGCIGFYGSSIKQYWSEPMGAQDSFNEQLIDEEYVSIGMLCYSAACDMMTNYMPGESLQAAQEMFNTWILFGDPSLQIIPNNNIGRTLFLEGYIDTDTTYIKDYVDVHNATIANGADVIINHTENTTITGTFNVEIGATLKVE